MRTKQTTRRAAPPAQVVLNTMAEFDADGDNRLNFREFKALLSTTDLSNKFSLNF